VTEKKPLVSFEATCPICRAKFTHRAVKRKFFRPLDRDPDGRVREYEFPEEGLGDLRPHYYHVWHCPGCHFADEGDGFRGKRSRTIEMLSDRILELADRPEGLTVRLGLAIEVPSRGTTLSGALDAHLLALFEQDLASGAARDTAKIGRLALRAAWLFREAGELDASVPSAEAFRANLEFLASLRDAWPDVPTSEADALHRAADAYAECAESTTGLEDLAGRFDPRFLVAAIRQRLGEREAALEAAGALADEARAKYAEIRKAVGRFVNRTDFTERKYLALQARETWLSDFVRRCEALRDRVLEEIYQREMPRARALVLSGEGEVSAAAVGHRLREAGFHDYTVKRVTLLVDGWERARAAGEKAPGDAKTGGLLSKLTGLLHGKGTGDGHAG